MLVAGSVLFALLVGEAAARLSMAPPYRSNRVLRLVPSLHRADPLIGRVLSPDPVRIHHRVVDPRDGSVVYDVMYSVDKGQRLTARPAPNGPALIATGCSFTFGNGLNDEDTWPSLLQAGLPDYRVKNVAGMGYGTDQALLAAERQIRQSPGGTAAVVLGFGDFQVDRNRSSQGWMVSVYPFSKPRFAIGPEGDAVYKGQVSAWTLGLAGRYSDLLAHTANVVANRIYGAPTHEGAEELTAALITTFAKRFEAMGVRLAVVVLPWSDDNTPQSRGDRAFVVEHLRAAHIPTMILDLPRLPDGRFDLKRFSLGYDKHPNRQYTQALAEQLRQFLLANKIAAPRANGNE